MNTISSASDPKLFPGVQFGTRPAIKSGNAFMSAPAAVNRVDVVTFSGSQPEHLKLAEELTELAGLDSLSVLSQIEQSLPQLVEGIKSAGMDVIPDLENTIKNKYLEFILDEGLHEKTAKAYTNAFAKTYTTDELQKLVKAYQEPELGSLLKKQQQLSIEVAGSPELQESLMAITQKLILHLLDNDEDF